MRVQQCPSCGAKYNVERLTTGSTFECRRCGHDIQVGDSEVAAVTKPFSWGLLIAGLVMIGGLFLYANPRFGLMVEEWPWEWIRREMPWSIRVVMCLWAVTGVWAVLSSLGVAPRTRSVLTAALGAGLLILCSADKSDIFRQNGHLLSLPSLLGMVLLAAGLLTAGRSSTAGLGRALAFGGGLMLIWWLAIRFEGEQPYLRFLWQELMAAVKGQLGHQHATYAWDFVAPHVATVLAALIGILAGLGVTSRALGWAGVILVGAALLLPSTSALLHMLQDERNETEWVTMVGHQAALAVVSGGFALWILGTAAVADLARNRGRAA